MKSLGFSVWAKSYGRFRVSGQARGLGFGASGLGIKVLDAYGDKGLGCLWEAYPWEHIHTIICIYADCCVFMRTVCGHDIQYICVYVSVYVPLWAIRPQDSLLGHYEG